MIKECLSTPSTFPLTSRYFSSFTRKTINYVVVFTNVTMYYSTDSHKWVLKP